MITTISRSFFRGGTNGALQVFYQTSPLDVLQEMLGENEDENSVFDYYLAPVPGKLVLPAAGTHIEVRQYDNPLAVRLSDMWTVEVTGYFVTSHSSY